MTCVIGGSKAKEPEDNVFPVSEMVARVIKALQPNGDGECAPDKGASELHREFEELRLHLTHRAFQGVLLLCRAWIRPLGFEASIFLAYIIEQNRRILAKNMTWDGYVEIDEDQIELDLCIDTAKIGHIIDKLRHHHIIRTRERTDEKGNSRTLCRLHPPAVRADQILSGPAILMGEKNECYKN
jgi:hypothetical protein